MNVVAIAGDTFFEDVTYKGAFGTDNWLDGWSLINLHGGFVSSNVSCPHCGSKVTVKAGRPFTRCACSVWLFGSR